jgi:predicted transcriptional regulator
MGKWKEHPRYNVISVRLSDVEVAMLDKLRGKKRRSAIMLQAFEELVKVQLDKKTRLHAGQ